MTNILYDRSNWGIIEVSDSDRLRFLHNQTTNDFNNLLAGQGCDAVFVSPTGRTLDLVTAMILEDRVLLLVSPNRRDFLLGWMDRYIFFADQVKLRDLNHETTILTIIGDASSEILQNLGVADHILNLPIYHHEVCLINNIEVRIARGTGLSLSGYTLLINRQHSDIIKQKLLENTQLINDDDWEKLRIAQGRPAADYELTDEYNPLEAGLIHAVSFNKGCYIGQETITRLNTYKGVKQHLYGIELDQMVAPRSEIMFNGERIGKVTSCIATENGAIALGYIRTKVGGVGLEITISEVKGKIISVPFLSYLPQ